MNNSIFIQFEIYEIKVSSKPQLQNHTHKTINAKQTNRKNKIKEKLKIQRTLSSYFINAHK